MKRTGKDNLAEMLRSARKNGNKLLAVLLDPDHCNDPSKLLEEVKRYDELGADLFLVGGSLLTEGEVGEVIELLKSATARPVYLFPGSAGQIHPSADGVLFLSLISGRNPELLIGQHVQAAPRLAKMDLDVVPTGYMLIDGGRSTAAHYMSQSLPIPYDKADIAVATGLAGQYLGLRVLYMDAGSGALQSVSAEMTEAVAEQVDIPLIVGGGIRNGGQAAELCLAGADMIVVGTALEEDYRLFEDLSIAVHSSSSSIRIPK